MSYLEKGAAIGLGTTGVFLGGASATTAAWGFKDIGWDEVTTALEGAARGAQEIEQFVIGTEYGPDELQNINYNDEVVDNYASAAGYGAVGAVGFLGSVGLMKKAGQYW